MFSRREFLTRAGCGIAAFGLTPVRSWAGPTKKLDVLVLGGTDFFGPTLVAELVTRGHEVTLFNRGITNPQLFPDLEKIRGDRELADGSGIAPLKGRQWDVVIDTWQRAPRCVRDTAQLLRGNVGQYQYVSSISVYDDWSQAGISEEAKLNDVPAMPEEFEVELRYSLRKTLAELSLMETLPDAHAVFRSHGMRGVRIPDPTDEPYWPVRIARGGDVLAPDTGETPIQFTDIVSLCRFMGHSAENGISEVFNVLSPRGAYSLKGYLEEIRTVTGSEARFTWVPRDFLETQDVKPYRDLPMWRPEPVGFYNFVTEKALAAGFDPRPLAASIEDMLKGYRQRHPDDDFEFGLEPHHGTISMAREREILAAWYRDGASGVEG